MLTAAVAAAGLVALGTVVAQSPQSFQPKTASGGTGTLPATTVRPYAEWTPTPAPPGGYQPKQPQQPQSGVQPAGGYLQPPPGYNPNVNTGPGGKRLTNPVMAGPDGVKRAGGFDLPPPDVDAMQPTGGGMPPASAGGTGRPLPPPGVSIDPPGDSKFPVIPSAPAVADVKPGVPPVPTAGAPPLPLPTIPGTPGGSPPPLSPLPGNTGPSPFPAAPPSSPSVPLAPPSIVPPAGASPVPTIPNTPTTPMATPPAPASTPAIGMMPIRTATSVTVEAVCPESVAFGQEFRYELIVRNTGTQPVAGVRVEDDIPAGARFVGSDPPAEQAGDRLGWTIGAMEPGAERKLAVRVKPTDEGDVRSRATVTVTSSVDARTKVTRPRIAVAMSGPEMSRAGEETVFNIKVSNSGTGPASRMVLQARLTDGLVHPQGAVIEASLDTLPPGETRMIPLKVTASRSGMHSCQVVVAAEGSPDAGAKAAVNVVEPLLQVKQTGPGKCLVRAEPTYLIELANPGTAATDPIQLHAVLPDGFDYAAASDGGSPGGRTITWRLPGLPAGGTRTVSLKLRAVAATDGLLRTVAQAGPIVPAGVNARPAGRGLEAKHDLAVVAEGVPAVRFEVAAVENPVEVGKDAVYEIRVMNQGTGPCTNVQLAAALADGTQFVGATSGQQQTQVRANGPNLAFEPIPSLGVKGEVVYQVRVRGTVPGDLRFRVQLTCDQMRTPVVKEESTRFYKE